MKQKGTMRFMTKKCSNNKGVRKLETSFGRHKVQI